MKQEQTKQKEDKHILIPLGKAIGEIILLLVGLYTLMLVPHYIINVTLEFDEFCESKGFESKFRQNERSIICKDETSGLYETFDYSEYQIWFDRRN